MMVIMIMIMVKFQSNFHFIFYRQAATAMRDISANPDYKGRCADDGGIQAMILLTRHPVEQLQVHIYILYTSSIYTCIYMYTGR
jgi:hypothetical protein